MAEHKLKGLNGNTLAIKNNDYLKRRGKSVIYLDDVTDFTVDTAVGLEEGSIAHVSGERGGTFEFMGDTSVHDDGVNFHGWKRDYSGAVSVDWFPNIKSCLNYVSGWGNPSSVYYRTSRPVLVFSSKDYFIDDAIRFDETHSNMEIQGNGARIRRSNIAGTSPYAIHIEGANNWDLAVQYLTINNLIVSGSDGAAADGIYIKNGFYNHLSNIIVEDFNDSKTDYSGSYGIRVGGDAWSNTVKNVVIHHCWNGLFVGERCNSCNFVDTNIEFVEQYSLKVYKNNDCIFTNCAIEFTERSDGSAGGDPDGYIGLVQSVSTKFYGCRFDGITGVLLVTGVDSDTYFHTSIGTLFDGCYFTPHSTSTPAYAVKINRGSGTVFNSCNASKIKEKANFTSALVRLDTDAENTYLSHCSLQSSDLDNPTASLFPISDGSTAHSYSYISDCKISFNTYESVPNGGVTDFYNQRAVSDGAAFRFYSRNASGTKTERLALSGQTDDCLVKLSTGTNLYLQNGTYNDGYIRMGDNWLWVDSDGNLRIKVTSAPTSDTDGTIVGTQA